MPRRLRPIQTQRSEHWLRQAVNECPNYLNSEIAAVLDLAASDKIIWKSPLLDDDYAEYSDKEFLNRLDLSQLAVPLESFWPSGGPCWDALARTASGKCILVEAKAYIEEAVDYCTHATDTDSLNQISSYLQRALWPSASSLREDEPVAGCPHCVWQLLELPCGTKTIARLRSVLPNNRNGLPPYPDLAQPG